MERDNQKPSRQADKIAILGRKTLLAHVNFTNLKQALEEVQAMVQTPIDQFGGINVLVNLAGYPARGEWNKRFLDLTPEDFFKPIDVANLSERSCALKP